MWRPEDWKNPFHSRYDIGLFELGADAILEALRKWHKEKDFSCVAHEEGQNGCLDEILGTESKLSWSIFPEEKL